MKKKKKSKKGLLIAIIAIAVAILAAAIVLIISILNKPDPIPADALGNTSGNINNRGLFCESDGYVYFSNPYDHRKLYKMKSDGTNAECIGDIPCEFINVYKDKLYFYQTPDADDQVFGLGGLYGICTTDINGKSGMNNLEKTIVNSLIMYGPYLYYQHYDKTEGLSLFRSDLKGKVKEKLSSARIFVSTPYNGKFLTYDEEKSYLLSLFNPETGSMDEYDGSTRAYNIIVDESYIYFMNIDDDYKIYRMSLSDFKKEQVTDYRVELFNVYNGNIFCQKSSEKDPKLMYVNVHDGKQTEVASGNFTNINCTSTFTYFYAFGNNKELYRVPTTGGPANKFVP